MLGSYLYGISGSTTSWSWYLLILRMYATSDCIRSTHSSVVRPRLSKGVDCQQHLHCH